MSPFLGPYLADLCPPPGSVPQDYNPQTYCICLVFLLFIEIRDSALSSKPAGWQLSLLAVHHCVLSLCRSEVDSFSDGSLN